MAKVGKHSAGSVPESVPHLKSRGLKNPAPQAHELGGGAPDMAMGNDGSKKKAASAPASGKKDPTK